MKFCTKCGSKLILKECDGERNLIPFCPECNEYRFPVFNLAIVTAIFSKDWKKILMMKQYGREKYNFLAGYVDKGENAEETLVREMQEEMGMTPVFYKYVYSKYFEKSNTLMLNYISTVETEDLSHRSKTEVDEVHWFDFQQASEAVIKNSLAEKLLLYSKNMFK